ncbi:D-3-phosphoglycerate dehydrogenase [Nonlabens dokdonensis]|uniref:D-isomer specific 2-hydroxyacid dehydrogenase, NAD-binding protein n=2 Tax=Nonlabens dokdonensis TaxID=328515 RepID=L7WEE7_NONDD|nr:NAD(P)-dependent oxidoreductase [Nonlabens dokdonensis]AGC78499.1 D-isomer specific 2-hydroxyacid dehydrogenase, NAD-binding protein [Nonlabens dokdonensis DSW-6]PZX38241.1 D-3-phosphoglycerate dehydrogenase [Nonlabens dokdonensis]
MKILANDGVSQSGIDKLTAAGHEVITTNVAQDQLQDYINKNEIAVLLVRSATTARKELIDNCPSLKIIGRGGVGMDNIDVAYAREKGLKVINTPAASSSSVAELVFGHLYGGVRFLYDANRNMPLEGDSNFKGLKKQYAKGTELRGKTIGIIGIGRIGQEVAKIAAGVGMNVIAHDSFAEKAPTVSWDLFDGQTINVEIPLVSKEELLKKSDFVTIHVPAQKDYVIGEAELEMMKKGAAVVNAARGGVLDEVALVNALELEHISFAALDVFEKEPQPEIVLLMNSKLSLSPHIGAATNEAQDRIGTELADQIIEILG